MSRQRTATKKNWTSEHMASVNTASEPRPPSNFSVSSEATEESLSNYAERTLKAIIARDQPGTSGISALLSPLNERTEGTSEDKTAEHK